MKSSGGKVQSAFQGEAEQNPRISQNANNYLISRSIEKTIINQKKRKEEKEEGSGGERTKTPLLDETEKDVCAAAPENW